MQVGNNLEDDVQQESISFDQSGSTAEYLRAHGPDIVLNLADVQRGNILNSSSSSSSSEISSAPRAIYSMPSTAFLLAESLAFAKIDRPAIPLPLRLPINMFLSCNSKEDKAECSDSGNHLALVPYKPTLHAVLISIWANSQIAAQDDDSTNIASDLDGMDMVHENLNEQQDGSVSNQPMNHPQQDDAHTSKVVNLPEIVSLDSATPLCTTSVRRSTRISRIRDGFKNIQHVELEEHPRKKSRVWKEVQLSPKEAALLLNNPPNPADDEFPGEIPAATLKRWGVECNVAPEELTDDALHAVVTHDNDAE
ncbi:unnamed protein product [Urochloa decumbens]